MSHEKVNSDPPGIHSENVYNPKLNKYFRNAGPYVSSIKVEIDVKGGATENVTLTRRGHSINVSAPTSKTVDAFLARFKKESKDRFSSKPNCVRIASRSK